MKQLKIDELSVGDIIKVGESKLIVDNTANSNYGEISVISESGIRSKIVHRDSKGVLLKEKFVVFKTGRTLKMQLKRLLQKRVDEWLMSRMAAGRAGCDPEIFLRDRKTGKVIPAFEFLPDKKKPLILNYGSLFWDGYQAEFNFVEGRDCLDGLRGAIRLKLGELLIEARKKYPDAEFLPDTTITVPQEELLKQKEEHIEFGCEPSFNAYGMEGRATEGRTTEIRPAGGHVHLSLLGKDIGNHDKIKEYVKALDKVLGVACVALFADVDDPKRRMYYGLAGEYRTPKHGLEYRVLSNAWLYHPLLYNFVFELARRVCGSVEDGSIQLWKAKEEDVIKCINNCDVELAKSILLKNRDMFVSYVCSRVVPNKRDRTINKIETYEQKILKLFILGAHKVLPNYRNNVMENWSTSNIQTIITYLNSHSLPEEIEAIKI